MCVFEIEVLKCFCRRLSSRHIQNKIKIQYYMYGFDKMFYKTGLHPIQSLTHIYGYVPL